MPLDWVGEDAFDEYGTRIASVARFRDVIPELVPPSTAPHWSAFLAHEYVLVDGRPGRWGTEAEAKAAVDAAYDEWLAGSDGRPLIRPSDAVDRDRRATGVVATLRGLVRAWRAARRRSPTDASS